MLRVALALTLALSAAPALAQAPPAPPPRTDCRSPERAQLDFWIGEWTVTDTAAGHQVGTSRITRAVTGCAIREAFASPQAPGGPYAGESYSAWSQRDGRWRQFYVDTNGATTQFEGGLVGADMVFIARGPRGRQRMTYRRMPDGSVRQIGEASTDNGATWTPGYDYTYRRAEG